MTEHHSIKADIRKRLFFAAEARREPGSRFGYQWCPRCGGRGDVCNERLDDGIPVAVFEPCDTCGGERVVAIPASDQGAR